MWNGGFLQNLYTGMTEKANLEGFIVVHPDALWAKNPDGTQTPAWTVTSQWVRDSGYDDLEFIRLLLDTLDSRVCFDRRQIYATGYSSGGCMSVRLACASASGELGMHKIAAIAPVSAMPLPWSDICEETYSCPALRHDPVPMRMIVSNNDTAFPMVLTAFCKRSVDVEEVNRLFRKRSSDIARENGCDRMSAAISTGRTGWGVLTETTAYGCGANPKGRADTLLDVFDATTGSGFLGGHIWVGGNPWLGGAPFYGEYKATHVVWEFFKRHKRR